jgi:hypothetical protein
VSLVGVARLVSSQPLRKTKVDKLDVALGIQKQVLRLDVPVGYPPLILMQVLQNQDDFGCIEAGHVLAESAGLAQVPEDLSARHVVEEDVKGV